MAVDKITRTKVEAELAMGKKPRELSNKYDIPYVTINGWANKMTKAKETDISAVVAVDPATLHIVADRLREEAPAEVVKKIDKLVDGVVGIQQLEPKFHAVVLSLLERAEVLSRDSELSIKDWKVLGDGISNMYANIFNKSGVSVNVMNQTQVSGEKLSLFKSSMRS